MTFALDMEKTMSRIDGLLSRITDLERQEGFITLSDGSKFKPGSGIDLLRHQIRLRRDLSREPDLADYPPDIQEEIRQFAKWTPDRDKYGQISVLAVELSRKLLRIE